VTIAEDDVFSSAVLCLEFVQELSPNINKSSPVLFTFYGVSPLYFVFELSLSGVTARI
jgi:hypothetical protein